jgi:branched-chain amino acid transport system ATP-binding protein
MLDEPLAGVNPTLERTIVDYVERLNDDGMTFLVIEHNVELLREFVDRLVVMHQGRVLADDDPETILQNDAVVDAYLGETLTGGVD